LNGLHGTVLKPHGDRWCVQLERGGAPVLVRPSCLQLIGTNFPPGLDKQMAYSNIGLLSIMQHSNVACRTCDFIVPRNMERLAGTCPLMSKAMCQCQSHYKARLYFDKEDWVLIDDLSESAYNGHLGQIISFQIRKGHTRRYLVDVDGILSSEYVQTYRRILRTKGSRAVSLPAANLSKLKPSVEAVRLHSSGEAEDTMDETTRLLEACDSHMALTKIVMSKVYLPPGLSQAVDTICPLMESAGKGLFLRPAPFRTPRVDWDKQCWVISQLRTDMSMKPPVQWFDDAGPHTVGWQDGSDFTMEDMVKVWSFFAHHRRPLDDIHPSVNSFLFMPQVQMASSFWNFWTACKLCTISKKLKKDAMAVESMDIPETVVDTVEHMEPAAYIPPKEASQIVHEQWASQVKSNIEGDQCEQHQMKALCRVLTFSRHPQRLDTALRKSALGRKVEEEGPGLQSKWAHGAKILVPGLTEQVWDDAVALMPKAIELRPYNVVVLDQDVVTVSQVLANLPGRRVALKSGAPILKVPNPSLTELFNLSDSSATQSSDTDCLLDSENDEWNDVSRVGAQEKAILRSSTSVYLALTVRHTFLEVPQDPVVSPRSSWTESAPARLVSSTTSSNHFGPKPSERLNPRIWAKNG